MDRILRLNEFFVEGGKQNISHVLLHITEPSTPEEINKGYFFAITEINKAESRYSARLQELIDQAENDYYELPDTADKTSLEQVLEKMNQEALGLAKNDIELHCVIGAIRQPEIIFSYYGKPLVVLFYKNQQGLYQKMDLAQSGDRSENEPNQLFSHIMQGKISPNDLLFAGTPHIAEFFSHDRLQKIITTRPAVQSAQHIERVLSEIKNGFSFGGLIMHIDRADAGPIPVRKAAPIVKGASSKSLHSLFNREQTTASTLSPSLFPGLNERVKALLSRKEEPVSTVTMIADKPESTAPNAEINATHISYRQSNKSSDSEDDEPKELLAKKVSTALDLLVTILKLIAKGVWALLYIAYTALYALLKNSILLIFVATNYQRRRQTILEDWRRTWRSYRENIKQLSMVTKVLFATSLIATGFVVGGISYVRFRQKEESRQQAFVSAIEQIRAKRDAMESALIYKDDSAALKELTSASELLNSITCTTPSEQQTCADLQSQLNDVTQRIQKIIFVNPETVETISTSSTMNSLVKVGTKLVTFSDTTSTLFTYDLLTKESTVITTLPTISGFTKASVPKENDYVALLYNNKDLLFFNPSDNTAHLADISYSNPKVTIKDIVVYNRRLYSLDTQNGQIFKHDSVKNGFGQGKEWIKDNTLVKSADELTIDGDMFVLQNGKLIKFTAGISQAFDADGIDPAIGENSTIWTYTDLSYLYVLDPANERLLVIGKDGVLKQQIKASGITHPTSVAVDAQNGAAYLLSNNKIFKIQIPQ